jgi:TPP-dependent 2-oxoacid decarboxylase
VPNCKPFLVTEAERKHVRQHTRFQQHGDVSCHQVSIFLQGKAPKKIHAILTETLGEHAPSYATVKNWVAQFKRDDFSICDAPRSGRPKIVNTARLLIQLTS